MVTSVNYMHFLACHDYSHLTSSDCRYSLIVTKLCCCDVAFYYDLYYFDCYSYFVFAFDFALVVIVNFISCYY